MRGQKVSLKLKSSIISKSLVSGCDLGELAKSHNISRKTIYSWRNEYKKLVTRNAESPGSRTRDVAGDKVLKGSGGFIELSVTESSCVMLEEASLRFKDFSLLMQGKFKSSVLLSVLKLLEESC